MKTIRMRRTCGAVALTAVLISASGYGIPLKQTAEVLSTEVIAAGLHGPAGMATDPKTDRLFVAERMGNRVSVVARTKSAPVLEGEFIIHDEFPAWALPAESDPARWQEPRLREPADLCFDEEGHLFIAEAAAAGRILKFDPLYDGLLYARILGTPWMDHHHGYTGVTIDRKGRLFAVSHRARHPRAMPFGAVLMRDAEAEWRLIDFGPTAHFSNPALGKDGTVLVVAEENRQDVAWYDTFREMEMRGVEGLPGVEHVAVLPDGVTVASIERSDGTWSVVEADPLNRTLIEWVGGLGRIGGLHAHPRRGDVYVSLYEEGKILRVKRLHKTARNRPDILDQLAQDFEMERTLPPRQWPKFFRDFITRLGVIQPANPAPASGGGGGGGFGAGDTGAGRSMTLQEFSTAIPVVAARLRARLLSPAELEPDPIEEINFVIFNPGRSTVTKGTIAPSISLFRAERQSGRVTRTRFLPNEAGTPITEDMDWSSLPDVLVSFPSGYYAKPSPQTDPALVRAYFLGMGLGSDYWLDIHRTNPEESMMVVEKADGTKLEYFLEPYDEDALAGGQSILVAGVKVARQNWPDLGTMPVVHQVALAGGPEVRLKHMLPPDQLDVRTAEHIGIEAEALRASERESAPAPRELSFRRRVLLRAASRW